MIINKIYDVNVNRVSEGIRFIEQFYYINNDFNKKNFYQKIRHLVRKKIYCDESLIISRIDYEKSRKDINKENKTKKSYKTLLISNMKRVQEGLRVLEEISKTFNNNISIFFNNLRLKFYIYEREILKDFYFFLFKQEKFYVLLDKSFIKNQNKDIIKVAKELIDCGYKVIQYRNKIDNDTIISFEINKIIEYVFDKDVVFIINDKYDLALKNNWPLIHLGQKDWASYCKKYGKKSINKNFIFFGLSVYNINDAKIAVDIKCNYIAIGALYKTLSKKDVNIIGINSAKNIYKKYKSKINIALIGGINLNNIKFVYNEFDKNCKICGISIFLDTNNIKEQRKIISDAILI